VLAALNLSLTHTTSVLLTTTKVYGYKVEDDELVSETLTVVTKK